jgi:hypothetical protein
MAGFTAIAAGVGLASTAATTTGSFIQAGKQRNAMLDAQKKADDAMAEARKKLDVNFYESLSIPKEAYAQQVQANLSAGAQALQAGVEGESRGAGAVAGIVQAQQNQAQNEIRANMGQDIYNLQAATAQEDARLRDIGIQLDLGEVEGAQLAAANAQELSAQALQQGMQGVTSFASQLSQVAPLYDKANLRNTDKLMEQYNQAKKAQLNPNDAKNAATALNILGLPGANEVVKPFGTFQQEVAKLGMVGGVDFSGVAKMQPEQFKDFMSKLSATTLRDLNNTSLFDGTNANPFLR